MIISCGEALIDFFKSDDTGEFNPLIGGSLLNVSVALAKSGVKSALMTNLSHDQFGDGFVKYLAENGVSDEFISRSDHLTGLMFVAYNEDKSASYSFYGHDTADQNYIYDENKVNLSDEVSCLHFGSFALVVGQTALSYAALINNEYEKRIISIDLNIREAIEPDMHIWDTQFSYLLPKTHIAKASADDVKMMHGLFAIDKEICFEHMHKWQEMGADLSIITDADKGAYVLWKGEEIHLQGKKTDIIDTVGAGDCFMANFLSKLDRAGYMSIDKFNDITSDVVKDAAAYAIDAATFTIGHKGAIFPSPSDL